MWMLNRNVWSVWTKISSAVCVKSFAMINRRNVGNVPLLNQMCVFGEKTAVIDNNGHFSYKNILRMADILGEEIKEVLGNPGKSVVHNNITCGPRIAFLCPNDVLFTVMVCAIWQIGGIAVPLCNKHPMGELKYVISDSQTSLILATNEYLNTSQVLAKSLNVAHISVPSHSITNIPGKTSFDFTMETKNADVLPCRDDFGAIILYTSGTTGKPKGVLSTHRGISSQILTLVNAWQWSSSDCILHVLPLHHTHGLVNVSLCSLWSGATCFMLPKFDPKEVWNSILNDNPKLNLFMAVPTIYSKLLQYYNEQNHTQQEKNDIKEKCQKFRLMVSGSSALPESVLNQWESITGMRLLERYGMTEIGMALSNPLCGKRLPGHVGSPLPNVKVKIVKENAEGQELVVAEADEHQTILNDAMKECSGELYVKGPSLFKFYWNKQTETEESFTSDGWFKTGDTVAYQNNSFKIVGRSSVDIIKNGGYKISALDIEDQLLTHPQVVECAVVGVPDVEWGQRIAAIVACVKGKELSLSELKTWAGGRMIPYHVPSLLKTVESIPRNAMGKVNKKKLVEQYFYNKHKTDEG